MSGPPSQEVSETQCKHARTLKDALAKGDTIPESFELPDNAGSPRVGWGPVRPALEED